MSDVVDQLTLGLSRPYFRTILKKLWENNQENADIICKHILTEQAEFNIKNSTKEGKIKILVWLSNFFDDKKRYQDSVKNTKGFLNIDNLRIKYPWLYIVIQTRINAN